MGQVYGEETRNRRQETRAGDQETQEKLDGGRDIRQKTGDKRRKTDWDLELQETSNRTKDSRDKTQGIKF